MRRFRVRFAACLAFATVVALGWMTEGLAGESAPPPPAKSTLRPAAKAPPSSANTPEEAAARFSKQLAAIYFDKLKDYKTALEFYKGMLETVAPEKRDTDGKWIKDKIAACEDKLKTTAGTAPGGKALPAKRAGS
jgi:hypothetical protein